MSESLRLDAREKAELVERGFVLRSGVFATGELRAIGDACEALVRRLLMAKRRSKHALGSYMFELQRQLQTIVKWEPGDPDVVQGLELFAHLSDSLQRWALDRRFTQPCKDLVGEEDIRLFTEKLTLKRAHKGGSIILHQDFPYWTGVTKAAARVATAMLFLDDATVENGCLEVVPGSHREGPSPRRALEGLGGMEIDPTKYDDARLQPLPVNAGTVIFFGPFLVHRSLPNRSGADRRALLFSYQPPGLPHLRDLLMNPQ
ncbi:MAG: phytanoyl-CoA dioxygenase family protein [Deltaproteobacteria bacterium]|nr:phytanoyl-CoA dioxygenase family protein [Deltaproteobacteria bacterium]